MNPIHQPNQLNAPIIINPLNRSTVFITSTIILCPPQGLNTIEHTTWHHSHHPKHKTQDRSPKSLHSEIYGKQNTNHRSYNTSKRLRRLPTSMPTVEPAETQCVEGNSSTDDLMIVMMCLSYNISDGHAAESVMYIVHQRRHCIYGLHVGYAL
eukprot:617015_1